MAEPSFAGVTLKNASPIDVKQIGSLDYEWTFECMTNDYATHITGLLGYSGHTTKTLLLSGKMSVQSSVALQTFVVNGVTHTSKCAILGPVRIREVSGTAVTWWLYTVTIVRDTT
jgi:hypothetical protein